MHLLEHTQGDPRLDWWRQGQEQGDARPAPSLVCFFFFFICLCFVCCTHTTYCNTYLGSRCFFIFVGVLMQEVMCLLSGFKRFVCLVVKYMEALVWDEAGEGVVGSWRTWTNTACFYGWFPRGNHVFGGLWVCNPFPPPPRRFTPSHAAGNPLLQKATRPMLCTCGAQCLLREVNSTNDKMYFVV